MCWMAIHRGPDALEDALEACAQHEARSGGHSWGFAAATADGELRLAHGLGRLPLGTPDLDADEVVAALAHTRLATRGEVTLDNAHPFPVHDADGEVVAALAHNGTWYDAPTGDSGRCDSYYIARVLESVYQARGGNEADFGQLVRAVGETVGETITVLHRDGRGFAYSGRFGITQADDWVQSSGGTDIPDGRVRVL